MSGHGPLTSSAALRIRKAGLADKELVLETLNARARALYERLGYEPDTVKYLKPLRPS